MIKKILCFAGSLLMLVLCACGGSGGGGSDGYDGYKVYANILDSEDYTSGRYSGLWGDMKDAFEEDDWIYIGEATETASFTGLEGLTDIMITWTQPGIKFDAFDDPVGGSSLGYDSEGNDIGSWTISDLSCDDGAYDCFLGHPDGIYATPTEYRGRMMYSRYISTGNHDLLTDTLRVTVVP